MNIAFPTAHPRLRADLVLSQQHSDDAEVLVVKDPMAERFFRFREVEAFILQQLNGEVALEEIPGRVREKFGASLPQETLDKFVGRLGRLGLLKSTTPETSPSLPGAPRVGGSLLYLRWRAFDPNRLLTLLARSLQFVFTPGFMVVSGGVIALALSVTVAHWVEIQRDLPRLYSLPSLLLAYLTLLGVMIAHEFAHGVTCKHFGGNVREIGFLLLYFQPTMYCNVSDAWLFPGKSRRLWVTFAGAYFEIFLWALATLTWRVTDPTTVVNYLALLVMATSGIKTLFNLNPLIKLDGYYLLSDLLDIPNLRQRAWAYLGWLVRRLWGSARAVEDGLTRRQRRIYLIYGVLAWVYSWWLLGFVALYFARFLVGRYQGWGFTGFVLFLGLVFRQPLKNLLRVPATWITVQTRMKKWLKRALVLGIFGALVAAAFLCRMELKVSGPFVVLPVHNADVRAEVEGIIHEVFVDEGQSVRKGDPIASLSERDYLAELRKTKAELEEKQARLNLLKAGARPEDIDLAMTLEAKAQARLSYATNRLEMDRALFVQLLVSKKEFEDTRESMTLRQKELEEARNRLQLLRAGSRKEDIEATEAEVHRLEVQQRYLEEQQQLLQVTSPVDGLVVTPKLKDKIGQAVKKGELIAKVHQLQTLNVEIAIPEKEIADVTVGQEVVLKARAYPHRSFQGRVDAIAPIATEPQEARAERTVRVTVRLDNAALLLKPEMTGHAKVLCGQERVIDLITRRLVRFLKVEFWSWW